MASYLRTYMQDAIAALEASVRLEEAFNDAADALIFCLRRGGTVFFVGNGGSASDAQHLAAELIGRFERERAPLRAVCLNTDTSVLTALANDYGYEAVFSRQVEALVGSNDVLVLISTSGASPGILAACRSARAAGAATIGLTGPVDSPLAISCQVPLAVGAHATCHIQEAHIALGQALCGRVEQEIFGTDHA